MSLDDIREFIGSYPIIFIPVTLIVAYLLFRLTRWALARGSYWIAFRTETTYDDLMVDALYPFRVAWIVPLILAYYFADYAYEDLPLFKEILLFLIIWVVTDFVISFLSGMNEIYEHRPRYSGISVAGYFGVIKVLVVLFATVLSISIFAQVPPAVLLGGLGAWLAVLLLIFRDTILAFVASVQISTQELVKDGDWIEVPGFDANGLVEDISLNSIVVRNFDNTITMIPTYKIVDVAFKNWRGMQESGARRMRRTLDIDINSIKFCDLALLDKLSKYDLITDTVNEEIEKIKVHNLDAVEAPDFPLDTPLITNIQLYMRYIALFLGSRKDLHTRRLAPVVQTSDPGSEGIPIDIFAFTKATDWVQYAAIQDEIILHLIAAAPYFELKLYQLEK